MLGRLEPIEKVRLKDLSAADSGLVIMSQGQRHNRRQSGGMLYDTCWEAWIKDAIPISVSAGRVAIVAQLEPSDLCTSALKGKPNCWQTDAKVEGTFKKMRNSEIDEPTDIEMKVQRSAKAFAQNSSSKHQRTLIMHFHWHKEDQDRATVQCPVGP